MGVADELEAANTGVGVHEPLPPLYGRWLQELLPGRIPREGRANCPQCVMCDTTTTEAGQGRLSFRPSVKCCSYLPEFPNFLVGRALSLGTDARGVDAMRGRVERGVGATPLGICQSAMFANQYRAARGDGFGRVEEWVCPHFLSDDGGQCGVWASRNAVCATYFCKHERGAVGARFWRAVKMLLGSAERVLSQWCLEQLQFPRDLIRELAADLASEDRGGLAAELTGETARRAAKWWHVWKGREAACYEAAWRLVERLSWTDVAALGGLELRMCAADVIEAYGVLVAVDPPVRPRAKQLTVLPRDPQSFLVTTYSGTDPQLLPIEVMASLPYFDGSPVESVTARLRADLGLDLDHELIQRLIWFEILEDVPVIATDPEPAGPKTGAALSPEAHQASQSGLGL